VDAARRYVEEVVRATVDPAVAVVLGEAAGGSGGTSRGSQSDTWSAYRDDDLRLDDDLALSLVEC
jgi:hypothetical protein